MTAQVIAVLAYLAAAAWLVSISSDGINPDGVAYLQNARHYASGRLDLAVNGWFGPLLSWLLVPFAWVGADLILSARWLGVAFGVGFAFGVAALTRRLGGGRHALLAFVAGLLLALRTVAAEITPDFLLAVGLTWYFVLAMDLMVGAGPRKAFLAGLVGGACYLVKAYGLTFVAAHLVMTFVLRRLLARPLAGDGRPEAGQGPPDGAPAGWARPLGASFGGLLLVALPWVLVISAQEGALTVSTAARRAARAWGPLPHGPWPTYALQQPRDGRVSVWENPAEAGGPWPTWHPTGGAGQQISNQLHVIFLNAIQAARFVKEADPLGMLACGWVVAGLMIWPLGRARLRSSATSGRPERLEGRQKALWLWAWLSVAVYLGGYVLLYLYERFTWGAWGVLLATAVSVLGALRGGVASRESAESGSPDDPRSAAASGRKGPPGAAAAGRVASGALAVLLLASLVYGVAVKGSEYARQGHEWAQCAWLRGLTGRAGQKTQVASNDWGFGLYYSFWTDSPFLGQFVPQAPDGLAQQLHAFGRTLVLVFDSPMLAQLLQEDRRFRAVGQPAEHRPSRRALWTFVYEPQAARGG